MNTLKRLKSTSVAINLLMSICFTSLIFCLLLTPALRAAELKAQLVNKIWEGDGLIPFETGQVQLTFPDGRTRLLTYRSHLQPVVANGKVYIFTTKDVELTGLVVYDSARGHAQSFPLPKDLKLNSYFGQPSFSPDGTRVAYYFDLKREKQSQPEERQFKPQKGFIDRTGKAVTKPVLQEKQWRSIPGDFSEGLAHARNGKKVGFRDLAGKIVIPPQFDEAGDFSEGLALVRIGKKWGFIDKTGKTVIPPQYYRAHSFSEGLASVNIGGKWGYGKWGFIDKTGNMVIPAQYDFAGNFSEGLAQVAVEGKYGFIDQSRRIVIQPHYDYVEDFHHGIAFVISGEEDDGGVRVRSWPDWRLLWQSPLCPLRATDVPPMPPIWETNSLVEFDPLFFDPPRFLSVQVPDKGGKDAN